MGRETAPLIAGLACVLLVVALIVTVVLTSKQGGGGGKGGGSTGGAVALQPPSNPCVQKDFAPCTDSKFTDMQDGGTKKYPDYFSGKCCKNANSLSDPALDKKNKVLNVVVMVATLVPDILLSALPLSRTSGAFMFSNEILQGFGSSLFNFGGDSGPSVPCKRADGIKYEGKNFIYKRTFKIKEKDKDVYYTANDGCPIVALPPSTVAYIADFEEAGAFNPEGRGRVKQSFQTKFDKYDPSQAKCCVSGMGYNNMGGATTCWRQAQDTLDDGVLKSVGKPGGLQCYPGTQWWGDGGGDLWRTAGGGGTQPAAAIPTGVAPTDACDYASCSRAIADTLKAGPGVNSLKLPECAHCPARQYNEGAYGIRALVKQKRDGSMCPPLHHAAPNVVNATWYLDPASDDCGNGNAISSARRASRLSRARRPRKQKKRTTAAARRRPRR